MRRLSWRKSFPNMRRTRRKPHESSQGFTEYRPRRHCAHAGPWPDCRRRSETFASLRRHDRSCVARSYRPPRVTVIILGPSVRYTPQDISPPELRSFSVRRLASVVDERRRERAAATTAAAQVLYFTAR
jgi:hypothetical protein